MPEPRSFPPDLTMMRPGPVSAESPLSKSSVPSWGPNWGPSVPGGTIAVAMAAVPTGGLAADQHSVSGQAGEGRPGASRAVGPGGGNAHVELGRARHRAADALNAGERRHGLDGARRHVGGV